MVLELVGREPFRLGNASIDPVSRDARWPGGEERLQPQTLKVLIALAAKRGEVVTRDELVELCWDGRIVGDDVVNRSVSLARHLAQRAGGFSIQTIPRAGYRLIDGGRDSHTGRKRRIALISCIGLLSAAIAAMVIIERARPSAPAPLRVAVLPFAGDSSQASRQLAAQMAEASVRMLTEGGVSVSALAVGAKLQKPLPDFVLSGAVTGSGRQAIATIQLQEPLSHAVVLSRQIQAEAKDPGALSDQVGANVAAALSSAEPLVRLDHLHPTDPAVMATVLNTNQTNFDSQRAFERARRLARTAPDSAVAQLALAWATGLNIMVVPAAERAGVLNAGRNAAERALRLAPDFGNSYGPWCLLHSEARIAECEARLRKGFAVDPQDWSTGNVLSKLLINVGKIDEAAPIAAEGVAKNAYAPGRIARSLLSLEAAGLSRDAEVRFGQGQRLWPHYNDLIWQRLAGMLARADFDRMAAFEHEMSDTLPADFPSVAAPLSLAVREHSLARAQVACREITNDDLPALECMLALAKLGDLDQAYRLAERIYPRRTGRTAAEEDAIWLSNPDYLDTVYLTASGAGPLRKDRRFLRLADQLGLLRYWREKGLPDFCTRAHEPVCTSIKRVP